MAQTFGKPLRDNTHALFSHLQSESLVVVAVLFIHLLLLAAGLWKEHSRWRDGPEGAIVLSPLVDRCIPVPLCTEGAAGSGILDGVAGGPEATHLAQAQVAGDGLTGHGPGEETASAGAGIIALGKVLPICREGESA